MLLRFALLHVEALQITDLPVLLRYCADVLQSVLSTDTSLLNSASKQLAAPSSVKGAATSSDPDCKHAQDYVCTLAGSIAVGVNDMIITQNVWL